MSLPNTLPGPHQPTPALDRGSHCSPAPHPAAISPVKVTPHFGPALSPLPCLRLHLYPYTAHLPGSTLFFLF